jgi:hypothetical protein
MTQITSLAAAIAALILAGCSAGEPADPISPQQQEALTDEMIEPDSLSGGYMAGQGIGTF